MTVSEFERSARKVGELADKYLGAWKGYYNLTRFDCGNVEFSVIAQKEDELLGQLPDETTDFPREIQFGWDADKCEWRVCCMQTITNVGAYKQMRKREKEGQRGRRYLGFPRDE